MRAVVYKKYGPPEVLKLVEIDKPKPKDNDILVKIYATTVTSGDVRLRSSDFPLLFWLPARLLFGLFKPKKKILGHELAGVIEEKGKNVSKFAVGDHVFGTTTMLPTGSCAEYISIPQEWKHGVISLKPKNLSFNEATALPIGAMTAMYLLERANLSKEQVVLIYGASGSVGSYAVQIAKLEGAIVVAVCSGANFEMVKSLGANVLIDYNREDYFKRNTTFDIVFDAVGKTTRSKAKKVLKKGGRFISVKMMTKEKNEHIGKIKALAEKGKLKPFIDKSYPLEDLVTAHRYVEQGHKKGNVVIEIQKETSCELLKK